MDKPLRSCALLAAALQILVEYSAFERFSAPICNALL
jgi:hypothetical protein